MSHIICPKCSRRIRNTNAWHYCKEVEIDDLFIGKPDDILLAFDTVLQAVCDWPDVDISGTKNCIVFVKNKTFLVIKPMTKWLEIKFFSNEIIEDDLLHKSMLYGGKYHQIVHIKHESQVVPKLIHYIEQSYQIC